MTVPPRSALDAQVREIATDPGRTWGVPDALAGILAVPLSLLLVVGVLALSPEIPGALATVLASALLAGIGVLVARRAARQSGGFGRALGLDLPRRDDVGRVLTWTLLLFVVQVVAVALLTALVPSLRDAPVENAGFLRDEPPATVLVFAVLAVVVAPVLEELLFRGLVLRGLMLRLGFWPAALLSSACFGLFHAQGNGLEALPIVVATGAFGLGLCVLVRRTARLGPAIGVHALRNAVAMVGVLLV